MKNEEIIANEAVRIGLVTAEEAKRMIRERKDIPLHTVHGWKVRGDYRVKEGAQPVEVNLWKKQDDGQFCMAKANLYTAQQVIKR